jgi:predicted nucleotidyltransferase
VRDAPAVTTYLELLRQHFPTLAEEFHVRSLGIFGSHVRNEQQAGSDLDVLVTFDEDPSLLTFLALENRLSDLLGVKVDLVMENALKPHLGERILRELVPV